MLLLLSACWCYPAVRQVVLHSNLPRGNRYLSEMEYEQAIVAFAQALAIDPKSAEAYVGLIGTYGESADMDGTKDF